MKYLLDTNIFIQSFHITYPQDIFPSFWGWLIEENINDNVFSINEVYEELKVGKDELFDWIESLDKENWFLKADDVESQNHFASIVNWVMSQKRFKHFAKNTFLECADPWLIAKCLNGDFTLVTQEKSAPKSSNKVAIPDVCNYFNIPTINTISLIRALDGKF